MPSIGRIQSTNFQALLTELGITRNNIPFDLRSEVSPVVLVGGTVSFVAAPTPPYTVPDVFSAGLLVAPVVNARMADTGPLPVGAYSLLVLMDIGELNTLELIWRNSLDTADLTNHRFQFAAQGSKQVQVRFDVKNANERFVVENTIAGNVGIEYMATIFAKI